MIALCKYCDLRDDKLPMANYRSRVAEVTAEIELIPHHTSINQFVSFWQKKKKKEKNAARIYFSKQRMVRNNEVANAQKSFADEWWRGKKNRRIQMM